ncbi:MAG: hypothetical protein EXR55_02240 [Dehalococcoidia bacterium]|nr:hypothetical protein [Dehalococcoidia bacterium]
MTEQREEPPHDRRGFLKLLSLGALNGLSMGWLPARWIGGRPKQDPLSMNLPGEGSIFAPRKDQRLEEWQRRHGQPKKQEP